METLRDLGRTTAVAVGGAGAEAVAPGAARAPRQRGAEPSGLLQDLAAGLVLQDLALDPLSALSIVFVSTSSSTAISS